MAIKVDVKFGVGARLFICLLMMAWLLVGCKSTRTLVNTKIKADSTVKMDVSVKSLNTSTIERLETVKDLSVITDDMTETVTALLLTAPDSAGKQYIISKTVTVRTRNAKQATNVVKKDSATSQTLNSNTYKDNSERKVDYKSAVTSDNKTKISTPAAINWGVLILVLSAIVIIVLILKKFKLL